jgi:ribonuclease HI
MVTIYTDGGARGNPGPGGCGAVIKDGSGKTIKEISEFLGHTTNNVAEYMGLVRSLEFIMRNKPDNVIIYTDSNLVVNQIQGKFKVKDRKIQPLHKYCTDMLKKLKSYQIMHVKREKNREADALANKAMDEGMSRLEKKE